MGTVPLSHFKNMFAEQMGTAKRDRGTIPANAHGWNRVVYARAVASEVRVLKDFSMLEPAPERSTFSTVPRQWSASL